MTFKAPNPDETIASLIARDRSDMFGIGPKGAADARSSYAVLPRSESRATTADDETTGTSRAFSFDISNHAVLASVDAGGMLTRLAISNGVNPVYETGLPGVFVNKDHDYVEGQFGIAVHPIDDVERGASAGASSPPPLGGPDEPLEAALIDNLIPTATVRHQWFDVSRTSFAPILGGGSPAPAVESIARVINTSSEPLRVRISIEPRPW